MKVRVNSLYRFRRAGWDRADPRFELENGALVRVVNLHGAPKANTMGHCYIAEPWTGKFIGMVSTASLVKEA
jgi:hypothetical protein